MSMEIALVEPEDLELLSDGGLFEFVHGRPVEKTMGAESDEIAAGILTRLWTHCVPSKLGRVFGSQTGFRCFPHDPRLVRKPDVSFVAADRLPDGKAPKGDFRIRPDLAVEVTSPNDLYDLLDEKLNDYFLAGVPLVWVVGPATKTVLVRRADDSAQVLRGDATLSGESVVPGFACRVGELFE